MIILLSIKDHPQNNENQEFIKHNGNRIIKSIIVVTVNEKRRKDCSKRGVVCVEGGICMVILTEEFDQKCY